MEKKRALTLDEFKAHWGVQQIECLPPKTGSHCYFLDAERKIKNDDGSNKNLAILDGKLSAIPKNPKFLLSDNGEFYTCVEGFPSLGII